MSQQAQTAQENEPSPDFIQLIKNRITEATEQGYDNAVAYHLSLLRAISHRIPQGRS